MYYTRYSTCVTISHRFITTVLIYFGFISSKSRPFVSGTTMMTKQRPTHEMQANSQKAPSSPSSSW